MSESDYTLALAFDSDSPEFARGFEAGIVYSRSRAGLGQPGESEMVHASNTEMFMRMSEALDKPFLVEILDDEWSVLLW